MKRFIPNRRLIVILLAVASLLFLSACSGVIGGDNMVRISIPGMDNTGRYISGSANSGYVVVLQGNKVYSLNNFTDIAYQELVKGNVIIANLPAGTYIFGVVLLDENDLNVGLAIKERKVEPGFNDFLINVGPGISTLNVNTLDYSDFFTPDGYTSRFAEDTIILDIDRLDPSPDSLTLEFRELIPSNTGGEKVIGGVADGNPVIGPTWAILPAEDGIETTTTGLVPVLPGGYKLSIILE